MKYFATLVLVMILAFAGLLIEKHNVSDAKVPVEASGNNVKYESY